MQLDDRVIFPRDVSKNGYLKNVVSERWCLNSSC